MKTEQILLALEISRCGSVSKAASNLLLRSPMPVILLRFWSRNWDIRSLSGLIME